MARQVKEAEAAAQAAASGAEQQQPSGSGSVARFSLPGSGNEPIELNFNTGNEDAPSLSGDDAARSINGNELQLGDTKNSAAFDDLSLDGDDDTVDLDDRNKR